jgi:aliphatic sulfonates family ABC transporter substrate-binding protein
MTLTGINLWLRYGYLFFLIAALGVSCGQNNVEQTTKPIRFAFQNRIGSAIPIIAVEKGFFKQQGLVVEPLRFSSGPACAEALYSGSADIGTMGDTTAIFATAAHPKLKIIASHSTGEHRHRLIVKKSAPYQTLEDLRGKRIGIKQGTSTHGGFLAALSADNIPHTAIMIVDLNPNTMPIALMAGAIDAFAASEPTPSIAEQKGGRELITFGNLGNQYPIMMLAHTSFLENRKKAISGFIRALRSAEAFVRKRPDETARILGDATGLSIKVTRQAMTRHSYSLTLDETILSSLRQTARFLKAQKKIEQLPNLSRTVIFSLLESQKGTTN